jgi:hypothetical protein
MQPSITPPAVKTKTDAPKNVGNSSKETKAKEAKAPEDPNAPKKERASRKDYGITNDGVITLTDKARDAKFRGKRAEFQELLLAHEGKTVAEFTEAGKSKDTGKGGSAKSWIRWFVQEGYATVEKPAA